MDQIQIGNANIDRFTFDETISNIEKTVSKKESQYVVTANTDHIVLLEKDERFQAAYDHAMFVTCDGTPLLLASWLLRSPIPGRVTGSDLMPALCRVGGAKSWRVAVIGGPPGTAKLAGEVLLKENPGLEVPLTYCPPLGFEHDEHETAKIIGLINDADVDIVFVGVGAPKQELWIYDHHKKISCGMLLGIGAAIEFTAGTIKRAPRWMRDWGLEWFHRMIMDPRRLILRYSKDTYFVVIVLKTFLRKWMARKNG